MGLNASVPNTDTQTLGLSLPKENNVDLFTYLNAPHVNGATRCSTSGSVTLLLTSSIKRPNARAFKSNSSKYKN